MYTLSLHLFIHSAFSTNIENILCAGGGLNRMENYTKSSLFHGIYIHPNMKTRINTPHNEHRNFKQGDVTEHELGLL